MFGSVYLCMCGCVYPYESMPVGVWMCVCMGVHMCESVCVC